MAGERKSFQIGKSVTVSLPEAVSEQISAAFADALGRRPEKAARARAAERLSADRIVDVAIEQMRESGYDAVTMRSIARQLDTGPASLYAHVAGREELDQLVVARVSEQWQLPDPDPEHWDDQLRRAMHELLEIYRAHPGVARCTMGMIPTTPGSLVSAERLLALLRAGGVADQHAAWFLDVASLYVSAIAMEEDIWRERATMAADPDVEGHVVDSVGRLFASLPAEHFPMLTSMAAALTTGSGDARFGFGVDLLVGGLKSLSGKR